MNTKILGSAVLVTSSLDTEVLKKLKEYAPEALQLTDTKGEVDFALAASNTGSMGKHGVSLPDTTEDGKACVTIILPKLDSDQAKLDYVTSNFGMIMYKASQVEAQASAVFAELKDKFASVAQSITIVG